MKKVGIITIHDVGNNFGSTIQSCAFYKYISDLGYDAKIIDYRPNDKSLKRYNYSVNKKYSFLYTSNY